MTQMHDCQNGGVCVLDSAPENFTCNCSGTNFEGQNCTGKKYSADHLARHLQIFSICPKEVK